MAASTEAIASPSCIPVGRAPSVSTVNEMTAGTEQARAARAMPMASAGFVIVNALDEIDSGPGEHLDLVSVVLLRLVGCHRHDVAVGVASRTDATAHHNRRAGVAVAEVEEELHRALVDVA